MITTYSNDIHLGRWVDRCVVTRDTIGFIFLKAAYFTFFCFIGIHECASSAQPWWLTCLVWWSTTWRVDKCKQYDELAHFGLISLDTLLTEFWSQWLATCSTLLRIRRVVIHAPSTPERALMISPLSKHHVKQAPRNHVKYTNIFNTAFEILSVPLCLLFFWLLLFVLHIVSTWSWFQTWMKTK